MSSSWGFKNGYFGDTGKKQAWTGDGPSGAHLRVFLLGFVRCFLSSAWLAFMVKGQSPLLGSEESQESSMASSIAGNNKQ